MFDMDSDKNREERTQNAYKKLVTNLDDMTKAYRNFLDVVRKEKDFLLTSDIEKLRDNNSVKESTLTKLKALDGARERYAKDLANLVGGEAESPRLLDIAQKMAGPNGDQLRSIHATLELLVRRATEINRENERYAQSALKTLDGAMGNIKDTLVGKTTYQRQGTLSSEPNKAGNFVRKEG